MTCKYIVKRGKRKGEECGEDTIKGNIYCTKHIKQCEKNTVFDDLVDSSTKISYVSMSENSYDFIENEVGRCINNKGFVVNCLEEKVIIGKIDKRGELYFLDDDDVSWCKNNNFLYERFI
jgi:hypothetical protein